MNRTTRRASSAASRAGGLAFGSVLAAVAAVRRGKAVHPHGVVHRARLVVPGSPDAPAAAQLLATPAQHDALVRFSRSVGLPRPLPDLLGMSIRVLDAYGEGAHQDLMLVTSIDLPVLHHLFVPARDVWERPYSSSLPYRAGDETFLVGAIPDPASPHPTGSDELDRLDRAAATGRLAFHLAVAPVEGRFRAVAELRIGERVTDALDALRFSPFTTGGGMAPSGVLNGMRALAYPMSQAAWRATRQDGDEAQRSADDALDAELADARG